MSSKRHRAKQYNNNRKTSIGNNTVLLFLGLFTLRLINALSIATFFQPDEFFQSLEPAWKTAFGEGSGAWITWEWHEHLRSSIHPLLFSGVYKIASQFADTIRATPSARGEILVAGPKILQALFAACTDLFTFRLAQKVHGSESYASRAALGLTVFSPWQWFCSVRTLSNSLETTLTVVALEAWPWEWFLAQNGNSSLNGNTAPKQKNVSPRASPPTSPRRFSISLISAALACILRPTNLLVWATITLAQLIRHSNLSIATTLVRSAILCGSAVLALSVATDRTFYGQWVFPPLQFIYFNIYQSLSIFYGQNRPDYYFTEGLALLLTTALPFAVVGLWLALRAGRVHPKVIDRGGDEIRFTLALAVITSVIVLSLISHKEVRFIYPLLPMLHILAAKPLATFFDPFPFPAKKLRSALLLLCMGLNAFIIFYTSYMHQRGVIDVMHYLRRESSEDTWQYRVSGLAPAVKITVGFFMPCHSTPWRSHLVYPQIEAWALTCEPPLNLTMAERTDYLDEADQFYADPAAWILEHMRGLEGTISTLPAQDEDYGRRAWPEYVVFFEQLLPTMKTVLKSTRYDECWRGFNTHWHDDWRRQGDVVVWCMHRDP